MRPVEKYQRWREKFDSQDYKVCPICSKPYNPETIVFDELSEKPVSFEFMVSKCNCYNEFAELAKQTDFVRNHAERMHRLLKHDLPPFKTIAQLQNNEKYQEAVNQFKSGKNVIITGGVGTGKTHTCCSAFWEIADGGKWVIMINAPRFFQFCLRPLEETSDEQVDILCRIDYLIIDDIGAYKALSDYQEDRLYVIIDSRYQSRFPTLITTQSKIAELIPKLSERVFSRLAEFGKLIKIEGEDWRLKK